MIRQRNIDPASFVGLEELERIGITFAASTQRFGTPVTNVRKIQLVDLTLYNDAATTGGGTNAVSINRTNPGSVGPSGSAAEVLIASVVAADAGAGGSRRYDLSNLAPIDVESLYAGIAINLMVKIIGTGTFTTGAGGFKLRYRPYLFGKD